MKRLIAGCMLALLVVGLGSVAFAELKPIVRESALGTMSQKPHWEE